LPLNDDEGWLDIIGDEKFYKLLGLRAEDEQAEMSKQVVSGDGAYAAADGVGAADAATGADGRHQRSCNTCHEVPGELVMPPRP
jgi:cytochrome c5